LIAQGHSRTHAAQITATESGWPRRALYELSLEVNE
jgi:hypothetical protein